MNDDTHLTAQEAAKYLRCHEITLAKMRVAHRGPPWFKLDPNKKSSPVRYSVAALRQWIAEQQT